MRSILIAGLWLAPSMALAQAATPADLLGPASPQMKGPPTAYRSVFGQQPPDPAAVPWRAFNDEAGRLGGHAGQLRESDAPASASHHDMHGAPNAAPSPRTHNHDHE